jgi:hypothetical protein
VKKPLCAGSTVKQNRTGDVHNLSEEEEIYRINDGMKSLQQFIPNSSKTDKASMLDEVYEYTKYLRLRQMAMDARMRGVDMRATGSGQGLIPVTSPTSPAVPHSMSVPGTMMDLEIQQRCKVEQLGMVHQSSSKGIIGNMERMNYGVNENGDHDLSGMTEAQVEDTDSERENALEGYQSEANTILQPDATPSTCFMLVSSSWLMHEVVKLVVIQVE